MKFCIYRYLLLSAPFLFVGCITPRGPSVTQHLHNMPHKTYALERDVTVSREESSIDNPNHMRAVLCDKNTELPKRIPKGARFTFDDLKEEYDYDVGVFPFFTGIGKKHEKYSVWLKFSDYNMTNPVSGNQGPLTLEYVWGSPGMIHSPPWENSAQPIGKNKRDLIRHLDYSPLYAK